MEKYKAIVKFHWRIFSIVDDKLHDVPAMQKTVTEITESNLAFTEYWEKGMQIQCCKYAILSEILLTAGVQKRTLTEIHIFFPPKFFLMIFNTQ
jgi:hypothetical protein